MSACDYQGNNNILSFKVISECNPLSKRRLSYDLDIVHAIPAKFKNGEKCDGSKVLASAHTIPKHI